ncbi:hypothetical protein KC717_03310 [Candidatus Dojkabacteria bacterium]|uniref:Uncharacterized protein n=1 Tax=Candidatus Dojkabacteria bacterium TaxID=2099670 RepID=A0A955L8H9_9BACT|nr:hypothetical protein [Candidatus Dojkabacteria bacterium]
MNKKSFIDKCFKDKDGVVVIGQFPNIPIMAWFVITVIALLIPSELWSSKFHALAQMFLFIWAYLELVSGVNYWRRFLGLIGVGYVVITLFGI